MMTNNMIIKRLLLWLPLSLVLSVGIPAVAQQVMRSEVIEQWQGRSYYIHYVRPGQQLKGVAKVYGVTPAEVQRANPRMGKQLVAGRLVRIPVKSILPAAGKAEQVTYTFYSVRQGDSWALIAREKKCPEDLLRKANPRVEKITPGLVLRVPQGDFESPAPTPSGDMADLIHQVVKGETLYSISRRYHTTVKEITALNPAAAEGLSIGDKLVITRGQKASRSAMVAQPDTTGGVMHHRVGVRETLYGISRQYGVSIDRIVQANPKVKEGLKIGQQLVIPVPRQDVARVVEVEHDSLVNYTFHKVRRSETLYGIAQKYRVGVDDIVRVNPGVESSLRKGSTLIIPRVVPASETATVVQNDSVINYIEHRVGKRENIYKIASDYQVDAEELQRLNPALSEEPVRNTLVRIPLRPVQTVKEVPLNYRDPASAKSSEPLPCDVAAVERFETFNVALMLPFKLEEMDSIKRDVFGELPEVAQCSSLKFIQFYEGVLAALDTLQNKGMNVRLWVYDADNGTGTEKTSLILREPVMKQMSLIIGPLYAPGFAVASRFAATYNIPIVNPLSGREEVLQHNSMVYRVQPSDGQYLATLARYIRENYPQANLFLVRQSAYLGSATVETFKKELFSGSEGMMEQIKVQDMIFNRDSTNQFTRGADTSRTNVLVTFSNRRAFISELMGELNNHRDDYDIALFGMPGWENIKLDVEQLMNLNTHIASATHINYNDSLTRWFVQHYRDRFYNEPLPGRYAFVGFDVSWYFLNALWHYGTGFDACLPYLREQGIERQFRFNRTDDNSGAANKTVYMLRFSDYELQQVWPEE